MLRIYVTFSLFFKIWLTESVLVFRVVFQRNFLLASKILCHKVLPLKISSFYWNGDRLRLVRGNYGGKFPVSIKYQNVHSFKEGMIHLCQSILETRRISHIHGSAPFTILLRTHWDISIARLLSHFPPLTSFVFEKAFDTFLSIIDIKHFICLYFPKIHLNRSSSWINYWNKCNSTSEYIIRF